MKWDILGAALWPVKYLQVKKQEMNENNEWTNECMKWEGNYRKWNLNLFIRGWIIAMNKHNIRCWFVFSKEFSLYQIER